MNKPSNWKRFGAWISAALICLMLLVGLLALGGRTARPEQVLADGYYNSVGAANQDSVAARSWFDDLMIATGIERAPAVKPVAIGEVDPVTRKLHDIDTVRSEVFSIFASHPFTLMCGCKYEQSNRRVMIETCEYRKPLKMALSNPFSTAVVQTIFPVPHPACAMNDQEEGERCTDTERRMYWAAMTDLHNLAIFEPELAQVRSGKRFGLVSGEEQQFGRCDVEVGKNIIEPSRPSRGLVARATLYMAQTYNYPLAPDEAELMRQWNMQYPPSPWEMQWNREIANLQGNFNVLIVLTDPANPQRGASRDRGDLVSSAR